MSFRRGFLVWFPYFDYVEMKRSATYAYDRMCRRQGNEREQYVLVLSASPQIKRKPERSNVELMMPASASKDPGCAVVSSDWKRWPVFQSQKPMEPLSAGSTTNQQKFHLEAIKENCEVGQQ